MDNETCNKFAQGRTDPLAVRSNAKRANAKKGRLAVTDTFPFLLVKNGSAVLKMTECDFCPSSPPPFLNSQEFHL